MEVIKIIIIVLLIVILYLLYIKRGEYMYPPSTAQVQHYVNMDTHQNSVGVTQLDKILADHVLTGSNITD